MIPDRLSAALADRYRIDRELGQGGMATVYLAEDLKHDRKVAVKVLRPELAAVLGAERFVQEIKTTASLQHPHILPLFDSGQTDGFLYYVMPYIEGETLRDKLDRETQLGIDEAVRITTEVADALDYAHRQGVIHRDIKPENILLHDGRPMVADFGIALAVSAAAGGRMTETGLSLGTPHYMSPEQATAEKDLTNRSDIYSLAAVLYEMLTGNPPHTGASTQQIIMKIVTEEAAPVTRVRKSVTPNVTAAVAMALQKLPADRFESAKAFADALGDRNFTAAALTGAAPPVTVGGWLRSPFSKVALGAVGVLAAATAWLAVAAIRHEGVPEPVPVMAFQLMDSAPPSLQLTQARDGTIAFLRDGQIFVRRPGAVTESAIAGTDQGWVGWPVLSPDGGDLAYVEGTGSGSAQRSAIRRVSLREGSSSTLWTGTDQTLVLLLAWSEDGWIYVSKGKQADFILARLRESGGEIEPIVSGTFLEALVLPGGKRLVGCVFSGATNHITAVDLATGDTTRILDEACSPRWSPTGHLLVPNRDGTLRAIPFDARRLRVSGPPTPVLDDVVVDRFGRAEYQLGPSGTLVYLAGPATGDAGLQMAFLDLEGRRSPIPLPPTDHRDAAISRDGRMVAYTREDQIWIYDLNVGTHWRLTTTGSGHHNPVWSPDGTRIAYRATRTEEQGDAVYVQALSGDSVGAYIGKTSTSANPTQWLADGTILAFPDFPSDIVALNADAPGPATELLRADWDEREGRVSPDGRWLAFLSNEAGRFQLMVRAWPTLDRKAVIADSVFTAGSPFWSPDSRTLYYEKQNRLMAAALAGTDTLRAASQRVIADPIDGFVADLHPDGRRFLVMLNETATADTAVNRLIAVTGWLSVLRHRLAGTDE